MPKAGWKFAVALWIGSVWNFVQGFHVESNNATPALDELLTSTTATEIAPFHRRSSSDGATSELSSSQTKITQSAESD